MLLQRILAALVFAPALLALIWFAGTGLAVATVVIALLSLWEFLRLTLGKRTGLLEVTSYLLAVLLVAAIVGWVPGFLAVLLLPAGTVLILVAMVVRPEPIEGAISRAGLAVLGIIYCGGLFPFIYRLREDFEAGLGLALAALFCTWGADTGAYFAGRAFGRHKLYAKISPGKTIEGLIGGLLSAVAVAFLARALFMPDLEAAHTVVIGLLAGAFGAVGDLGESLLKRSVGAKDSSRLIPGHGGVLDRFDAVMFAAPVVYIYARLLLH